MANVDTTLTERGGRYGDFSTEAMIADTLIQDMIRVGPNWHALSAPHREALRMFAMKIGRILNGDPHYKDNWHDIQGYAKLAEDRCEVEGA